MFYVELYRGQITATTHILSPAARHGNGAPSSKAESRKARKVAKDAKPFAFFRVFRVLRGEEWLILHEVKPRWIKSVLDPVTIEPFEPPTPF